MGQILCCVEDKRQFDNSRPEAFKYEADALNVHKGGFLKHPVDKQQDPQLIQDNGQVEFIHKPVAQQLERNTADNLVDDHLEDLQIDAEDDEVLVDLDQRRNQYEPTMTFTKNEIKRYVDQVIQSSFEENESKLWELKLNKEEVKVYIKKGGSEHNADQPYIKTEIIFNSYLQMNKIIKAVLYIIAIFAEEHRIKWDKNVLQFELIPLTKKNINLNYQMNKSPLNFSNRDFFDKHIKFVKDGVFYCYYSAIPNSEQEKPIPPKVERAITFIGIQKMERRALDNKIVYTMLMQCDLKMKVTPKLITMFLPNGLQEWSKKLNKYMMDNYDKI